MILKKFLKKNNFGHHGARNGAQTDLTLCAITRPFLKIEPWNVNNFFFSILKMKMQKKNLGWIFFLKIFYGHIFFVWWLRTLNFFANWFFCKMRPSLLSQRWFYGWSLILKTFYEFIFLGGGGGGTEPKHPSRWPAVSGYCICIWQIY